jgi:hypothetical protein
MDGFHLEQALFLRFSLALDAARILLSSGLIFIITIYCVELGLMNRLAGRQVVTCSRRSTTFNRIS